MAKKSKTQRAKASARRAQRKAAKEAQAEQQKKAAEAPAAEEPKKKGRQQKRAEKKAAAKAQEAKQASSSKHAKAAKEPKKPGRVSTFFKGVRAEMKRVTWPSRAEVGRWSGVVVGTLVFFGLFVFILDNWISTPILLAISHLGA